MSDIEQNASAIAHDLDNLLWVLSARYDGLERLVGELEPHRRVFEDIRSVATKSLDLLEQLLDAGQRQFLDPRRTDLNDVVTSTLQSFAVGCGDDIALRTDLQSPLWSIRADPSKLRQAILNVLTNARDAMPNGGVLAVETLHLRADRARQPSQDLFQTDHVALIVRDTGIGIPAEIRDFVFDPFFSTKRPDAFGTGLGLSIARGVVEQSGGRIRFSSDVGKGTTFEMYFPRLKGARAEWSSTSAVDSGTCG